MSSSYADVVPSRLYGNARSYGSRAVSSEAPWAHCRAPEFPRADRLDSQGGAEVGGAHGRGAHFCAEDSAVEERRRRSGEQMLGSKTADGRSEEPTIGPGSRCPEEATRTGYGRRRAGEASALATLSRHQLACTRLAVCLPRVTDRVWRLG